MNKITLKEVTEPEDEKEYMVMSQVGDEPSFQFAYYHYDCEPDGCHFVMADCDIVDAKYIISIFEHPENVIMEKDSFGEEDGDENTVEDGFGSTWSVVCPECNQRAMFVVKPGKVQCGNCG